MNVEKDRKEIARNEEKVMLPNLGIMGNAKLPPAQGDTQNLYGGKSISRYHNSVWVRFDPDLRS